MTTFESSGPSSESDGDSDSNCRYGSTASLCSLLSKSLVGFVELRIHNFGKLVNEKPRKNKKTLKNAFFIQKIKNVKDVFYIWYRPTRICVCPYPSHIYYNK